MADAVAPQAGEATPSNINPTETQASAQVPEAANAPAQLFTPEEAQELKSFLDNNGGLEKIKKNLSARTTDAPKQPEVAPQAQPQTQAQVAQSAPEQPQPAPQPESIPHGFKSPKEIIAEIYNERLESHPEYEAIKDYIHKGEYIKEMEKWGMIAFDKNGNANDVVIRDFLDLKAKAAAPAPTSAPVTNTPMVEYTNLEGDIADITTAKNIYMQGASHPRYQEAADYIYKTLPFLNPTTPEAPKA